MDIINLLNCGSVKNFFRDRSLKHHFIVAVRDVMGRREGSGLGPVNNYPQIVNMVDGACKISSINQSILERDFLLSER